jgi:hypothetical protein
MPTTSCAIETMENSKKSHSSDLNDHIDSPKFDFNKNFKFCTPLEPTKPKTSNDILLKEIKENLKFDMERNENFMSFEEKNIYFMKLLLIYKNFQKEVEENNQKISSFMTSCFNSNSISMLKIQHFSQLMKDFPKGN